ncbi:MAG: hypothetical protein WC736_15680 [Gallionella sp.]|jgi:hypothetical protein
MSAIKSPFPQFYDTDGGPLNAGFIYIGTAGQNPETNPITVYWDSALTQPAAQPLRTLNGYISRAGTPALVYASSVDYSITVRNNRSELVFSALAFNPLAELQVDLAAAIHAAPLDADPSTLDEIPIWDQLTGTLRKITYTFLQSGAGAALMTVRRALRLAIWVEHYGADPAALPAVNDAAFAAAIAEALARGGDIVNVGAGRFNTSAVIVLESKVFLLGRGSKATEIFLANFSNCDMLASKNFAALTGTNTWLVSAGMQYGFGIDGIKFNGNRANQLSGNGIRLYGKGYHIGFDVMVVDPKEIGFYSEASYIGGQNEPDDMPEGNIGKVQVYQSGKEGFVYRGPHDQPIHDISVSRAGQDGTYHGVVFEGQINVYNGATYITGSIHSYACSGRGIVFRTHVLANQLTGESCIQDGVVFEAPGETAGMIGGTFATANLVEAYHNDINDSALYWGIRLSGGSNTVSTIRVSSSMQAAGGVYVNANHTIIEGGTITGANAVADGIGLKLDASYLQIAATIANFDSGAAVGLQSETVGFSNIKATIFNCATSWLNNVASSAGNKWDIRGTSAAGTAIAGAGTFSASDSFDVKITQPAGTNKLSHYNDAARAIPNGATSVTLTHNAFKTPLPSEIDVTLTGNWANAGVARSWWIANITATQFDVVTDVAAPVGGLPFSWKLNMN